MAVPDKGPDNFTRAPLAPCVMISRSGHAGRSAPTGRDRRTGSEAVACRRRHADDRWPAGPMCLVGEPAASEAAPQPGQPTESAASAGIVGVGWAFLVAARARLG